MDRSKVERLRFAFDAAVKALLDSHSDTVTLPRSALTPLLDYVGLREFTFAATAARAQSQEPKQP